MPAAEKLEAVARIEIFRCMDDLQQATKALDVARKEVGTEEYLLPYCMT